MPAVVKQTISLIGWDFINDLSALPENEDIITDFLLERLQHGQIYTWIGSLLLTINPNNEISTSHLYNTLEFDKHIDTPNIYQAYPHIFTVAAKAYYKLTNEHGRNCQVIVISGETGTGKTFNACKCLEFLSSVNERWARPCHEDQTHNVMHKITEACRLISAFTSACTERNEVSSRHGQLIRLRYKGGIISGATIDSLLLERSRVTKGSCNFHIFYQMIFGMLHAQLETFDLSRDEHYDILSVIDCDKQKYFEECFQGTLRALDLLNFKPAQKKYIFQTLALAIHMGNVKFIENGETCTIDLNDDKSRKAVESTCALSSLTKDILNDLLTTILINPQSSWKKHTAYQRHLATADACRNRLHSVIRHIYDLLFQWILNHINNTLSIKDEYTQWLGILDIFGFEIFNENGIEQLCVNYANEKLQQYFIETYMENSRRNLEEEVFIDNCNTSQHNIHLYQQRLRVIEDNLFLTLNDACQNPVTANTSTITQQVLKNLHSAGKQFLNEREGNFVIEHYCGPVAYSVEDLLSKNTDKVPTEISVMFSECRNEFLRTLINIGEKDHLRSVKVSTKKKTMVAKLKYNMDTLLTELSKCDLHYVRCVKPSRLGNNEWDRKDLKKQLACIGIFDTLPLAKCKYPIRLSYQDFYQRYSKRPIEIVDISKCKLILESIVPKEKLHTLVHFGKQLIFLTESIFYRLESNRKNYHVKCANKIKRFWLNHRCRTIHTISQYSTSNCQVEGKLNKNITPTEITLIPELEEANLYEGDDILLASSILLEENNVKNIDSIKDPSEMPSKSKSNRARKKFDGLKKIHHDLENWQKKLKDLKHQFRTENCFKDSFSKFMRKMKCNRSFESDCNKDSNLYNEKTGTNFNDINNNLLKSLDYSGFHVPFVNKRFDKNGDGEHCSMHYDTETDLYTIKIKSCSFFYKNGILSRRRLAAIPIRMHIRPTCLINSHILPNNQLPKGLQDCL